MTKNEINTKRAELKKQLESLDRQEQALALLTKEQEIAILLHSRCCHSGHEDNCDWYYGIKDDIPDFKQASHKRYLLLAREVIKVCDEK